MTRTTLDRIRDEFFAAQTRYEYVATLGSGGMGAVFRARDKVLEGELAIKVMLHGIDVSSADALTRFKREVQLNRKVKHPNVARLFDFGVAAGIPYVTMELVPGRSLADVLKAEEKIGARRLVPILRQVALGTAAAHELGIIHRDLKPQNIMVDDSGAVALLDFGLARDFRSGAAGLTSDGEILGTPHYLAPELGAGEPPGPLSDLWSIGVVAFAALSGDVPFTASTPLGLFVAIARHPFPEERLRAERVPQDVIDIVRRCLEKEPSQRYPTCGDLATVLALADLELMTSEEEPFLPPSPPPAHGATQRIVPRILVVDDDAEFRAMVKLRLETAGYSVLEAPDGEAALQALQGDAVDLVVMDVQMPKLDGFDVTRILKAQPRFAKLPIVLMSGFSDRGRLAFAIQAGATDFVPKQQSMTLTVERIRSLIGVASGRGDDAGETRAVRTPRERAG